MTRPIQQLTITAILSPATYALAQTPPIPPEFTIDPVTGDIELTLPTELDLEYTLERSQSLSNWEMIGETILGNTVPRTITQTAPLPDRQFFRVQSDQEFEIDATTFGYGEPGRTWVYEFSQIVQFDGQVTLQDNFDQTRILTGPVERNGIMVYDLTDFNESGTEVFVNYFAADFTEGVFAVGSRDPNATLEESFNNPPIPEIASVFTPGIDQVSMSTNTTIGESEVVLQISIHPGNLTVPAGTFREVVFVTRISTGMSFLGSVRDVSRAWWVRGVGPIMIERDTTLNGSETPNLIQRSIMVSVTPG